jgi:hypothetical protein
MRTAILLLSLAATAQAQVAHTLIIDKAASAFTWSGNTSLGPIIGVPDNNFNISGTLDFDLWSGSSQAIGQGQSTGGDVIMPDITGEIPGAFGIPLATITLNNVRFTLASSAFPVDIASQFSTTVTLTATQGSLTIDPFIGSSTTIDLTGLSVNSAISGTINASAGSVHLDVPVNFMFSFTDPGTGISGDLTLDGKFVADYDCEAPVTYCVLSPNSAGPGAAMGSSGSTSVFDNDFRLNVSGCPTGQFGIFFYGPGQTQVSVGDGTLCIGGSLVRLPVVQTDIFGQATFLLDNNNLPGTNQILAGDTFNFAFWFRDPLAPGLGLSPTAPPRPWGGGGRFRHNRGRASPGAAPRVACEGSSPERAWPLGAAGCRCDRSSRSRTGLPAARTP